MKLFYHLAKQELLVQVLFHNIFSWLTWGTERVGSVEIWKQHALSSHGIQVGGLFRGLAKHPQVPPTHLRSRGKEWRVYWQLLPIHSFTPRKVKHTCKHRHRHCAQAAVFNEMYRDKGNPQIKTKQRQREGKRERNIFWAVQLIRCSNRTETHKAEKITHVIHEHDDNVWGWNIWWLFCQGATYYCTKESQSYSRHHSHCCAAVMWASTSRKWFVCLRAGLLRDTCAYAVESFEAWINLGFKLIVVLLIFILLPRECGRLTY